MEFAKFLNTHTMDEFSGKITRFSREVDVIIKKYHGNNNKEIRANKNIKISLKIDISQNQKDRKIVNPYINVFNDE